MGSTPGMLAKLHAEADFMRPIEAQRQAQEQADFQSRMHAYNLAHPDLALQPPPVLPSMPHPNLPRHPREAAWAASGGDIGASLLPAAADIASQQVAASLQFSKRSPPPLAMEPFPSFRQPQLQPPPPLAAPGHVIQKPKPLPGTSIAPHAALPLNKTIAKVDVVQGALEDLKGTLREARFQQAHQAAADAVEAAWQAASRRSHQAAAAAAHTASQARQTAWESVRQCAQRGPAYSSLRGPRLPIPDSSPDHPGQARVAVANGTHSMPQLDHPMTPNLQLREGGLGLKTTDLGPSSMANAALESAQAALDVATDAATVAAIREAELHQRELIQAGGGLGRSPSPAPRGPWVSHVPHGVSALDGRITPLSPPQLAPSPIVSPPLWA